MQMELDVAALGGYVARQIGALFPIPGDETAVRAELNSALPEALDWAEECFSLIKVKCFRRDGRPYFSPLIGDQYAMFLYMLAHTVGRRGSGGTLASRLYLLNKALHGLDVFYEVKMPRVFLFVHPLGTVLGRANYGDRIVIYQGVTVGGNTKYEYPDIGRNVVLYSNSSVLGRCRLNDGALVAARACLMEIEIPANHVAFGLHPAVKFRPAKHSVQGMYYAD